MRSQSFKVNTRKWIFIGFAITTPSLLFWSAVVYSKAFHDPKYVDALLAFGGDFTHFVFKALLPMTSLVMAAICNKFLRDQAIAGNMWHRETPMMKANQRLINWDILLLAAMFISLINN